MKAVKFEDYIIWNKTNKDPGFYEDLGPLFGSREVEKELGGKMYDDPDRIWIIAKQGTKVAGVASIEIKNKKAYFKNTYVLPEYRNKGLYGQLCDIREKMVQDEVNEIFVTARAESYMAKNWIDRGYLGKNQRGQFIVFHKVVSK